MVVSSQPTFIPIIDLSNPDSKNVIVKACMEFGFFKVINHQVSVQSINNLQMEAVNFFSQSLSQKEKAGPANPFGYGNKNIGPNGDIGWVEYLLLTTKHDFNFQKLVSLQNPQNLCTCVDDYAAAMKNMSCEILELMADGLKIKEKNVFSKLLKDEQSDSVFRINHYPPFLDDENLIGFGEHTDPQIISVLRSNNTSGLQILLKDGKWVSVPPDHNSFFVIVGDSLQVLTNGRFKSVKHRVLANKHKSRVSMIYFGAPALSAKISPLPSLMQNGEQSLYKEFTWFDYKKSVYKSRLSDDRLQLFQKIINKPL